MFNTDRIPGRVAADILGLKWPGRFSHTRLRLERYRDKETHEVRPYPPQDVFDVLAAGWRCSSAEAEKRWRRDQVLVVPEWGGVSVKGGDWSFSHEAVVRWLASLVE